MSKERNEISTEALALEQVLHNAELQSWQRNNAGMPDNIHEAIVNGYMWLFSPRVDAGAFAQAFYLFRDASGITDLDKFRIALAEVVTTAFDRLSDDQKKSFGSVALRAIPEARKITERSTRGRRGR